MDQYDKQALDFAKKHGLKFKIISCEYKVHGCFDDNTKRYVFKCRLIRNGKIYTFDFGQSLSKGSEEPALYDILACMTKYDVGTFDDFCDEFGYDSQPMSKYPVIHKLYNGVLKEYKAICRLFPEEDVMDEFREII